MRLTEAERAERHIAVAAAAPAFICILEDAPGDGAHLEALLASAPGATALGEARRLWTEPLDALPCSCGATVSVCGHWREVLIRAGMGAPTLKRLAALEERALAGRRLLRAGLSLKHLAAAADMRAFFALEDRLFSAIAAVSGARLLIERTACAPRAWALATRAEVRVARTRGAPADGVKADMASRLLRFRTGVAIVDVAALAADPREEMRRALGPGIAGAVDWREARDFAPDPNRHALSPPQGEIARALRAAFGDGATSVAA
ncbi:MAG: hypothetical protein AAFN79_04025 [Pseudomonadota bacterium]